MATKKKRTAPQNTTTKKARKPPPAKIPAWVIVLILIITFLAFIPALRADFVLLDDPDYVTENPLIKSFSNIAALITTPIQGNYHPLTMISLALNYAISGDNAWSYHLLNLLIHLINCLLVFRLAFLLSNKNLIIAFTTAILFAIHPMHVESVAWISERKDVLYGLFFLAGLISYTKYVDTDSRKQYLLAIIFLILSLLSKPAAVIFPVALFCIDILRKRKLTGKLIAEKIPFIIPALIMGVLTLAAQKQIGATIDTPVLMGTRILFAFYGVMMYAVKMIAPVNLSPFYPFPPLNEQLPAPYFIAPLFFVALVVLIFVMWRKHRTISFGVLFYLVNLLLVLQFFSVGGAVIADRYTYLPHIGLFYVIGWVMDRYAKGNFTKAAYFIMPAALILVVLTFKQADTWINSETMWTHAAKITPSSKAYSSLGVLAKKEHDNELALQYFNKAIQLNVVDNEPLSNRGDIYFDERKLDSAYNDYKKVLELKPNYYPTLNNLGALYILRTQYDSALEYLNKALSIKEYAPAYRNRGIVYLQLNRHAEAIRDFEKFLAFQPEAEVQNSVGLSYRSLGKYDKALEAINKAIQMNPDPHYYLNRSYAQFGLNHIEEAKKDALQARQKGLVIDPNYLKSLGLQ
jgi:tetratricopeptide (TPR) repeat protein